MTVAWIAWRELRLVRESSPEYAEATTKWRGERLSLPSGNGGFRERQVWSIVNLGPRTNSWLRDAEINMRAQGQLPKRAIPISDAWVYLRQACEHGDLIATAIGEDGRAVEIPPEHWQHLKVFEEREKPSLKYNALDSKPAYTEVSFRRTDVTKCWVTHRSFIAVDTEEQIVEKTAYAPLEDADEQFAPLSSAIYWVATMWGTKQIKFGDVTAWEAASKRVAAKIRAGEIELIVGEEMRTTR